MFGIGTLRDRVGLARDPRVHVEVQAADLSVPRGIVRMVQFRPTRDVAFELQPVQSPNTLLCVRVDERVQFTVGDLVENPAIGADVLRRTGYLDSHPGISHRGNDVTLYFALWCTGLPGE